MLMEPVLASGKATAVPSRHGPFLGHPRCCPARRSRSFLASCRFTPIASRLKRPAVDVQGLSAYQGLLAKAKYGGM